MSCAKDLFEIIGSAVGVVQNCYTLAKELLEVLHEELRQLMGASEGTIDLQIKTQLTDMINDCKHCVEMFEMECQTALSKWGYLREMKVNGEIAPPDFIPAVQALRSEAETLISSSYAELREKLYLTRMTAATLAARCKRSINEAKEARSDNVVRMGTGGLALCCALSGALTGSSETKIPIVMAGGAAGSLFAFKAYDRVTRLNELIKALQGHLVKLEDKTKPLDSQADRIRGGANEIEAMYKEAEAEIMRAQREQEEIESRAQQVSDVSTECMSSANF